MNGTCGTLSIYCVSMGNIRLAALLIIFAAVFDFFDGFSARLLKSFSPLGKDLDSLADLVSFAVAPSFLIFSVLFMSVGWWAVISVLIVPASIYRLAKFNHDTNQVSSFIGLPTPANALFFIGASLYLFKHSAEISQGWVWFFLLVILLMSYLLVSPLPMYSFKMKRGQTLQLFMAISLVLLTLTALIFFQELGLVLAIIYYLLSSVVLSVIEKY